MRKVTAILLIAALALSLCACNGAVQPPAETDDTTAVSESEGVNTDKTGNDTQTTTESYIETDDATEEESNKSTAETVEMKITITAGEHTITATLYDNAAGRALWDKLPLTLPMMNLYGREMCYRFGAGGLPDNDAADTGYEIGDISYWPPAGSLVILYKQNGEVFEQQPIGHTDDDVSFLEGIPDTDVIFEKIN